MTGQALTTTGVGLGPALSSIGTGAQTLLGGIGTGSAQLLNPLFSLKTLIYGDDGPVSDNEVAQIQNASNVELTLPTPNTASSSPAVTPETEAQTKQAIITFPSGSRTTYPLSQAAIDYYRDLGVEVTVNG